MLLASLATLGWLVSNQWDALTQAKWSIDTRFVLGGFLVDGVLMLLGAAVFGSIIDTFAQPRSFKQHLYAFGMNMVTRRIPGTVWYVLFRNSLYGGMGYSKRAATYASGLEWLVTLASGLILAALTGSAVLRQLHVPLFPLIIALLAAAVLLSPPVTRWTMRRLRLEEAEVRLPRLIVWMGLYLLIWLGGGVMLFLMINALHPVPGESFLYVIGCWALVGAVGQLLVFLPSNLGFTEVSLSLLLAQIMPSSIAVVLAILFRIAVTVFEIVWTGLFFLFYKSEPADNH